MKERVGGKMDGLMEKQMKGWVDGWAVRLSEKENQALCVKQTQCPVEEKGEGGSHTVPEPWLTSV